MDPRPSTFRVAALVVLACLASVLLSSCGGSGDPQFSPTSASPRPAHPPGDRLAGLPHVDRLAAERLPPIAGVHERLVGHGDRAAWVLWRGKSSSPPSRRVIVFLHGWSVLLSTPRYYNAWIGHLTTRGVTVIFPVYLGPTTTPPESGKAAIAGIAEGLRSLRAEPRPLVVAGVTTGGALAFDYAAAARREGLPAPRAIYSVFPARNPGEETIPAVDPRLIDPNTLIEVLAGKGDPVLGGEEQARRMLAAPRQVPEADRRYLAVGTGPSPTESTARARRAYWAPLDRLVSEAQQGGS